MVLKNKRGWLRILEAFIGVMIIAGVLLFIVSNRPEESQNRDYIYYVQSSILEEIATSEQLRLAVLRGEIATVNNTAKAKVPSSLGFDIRICDLQDEVGCKVPYTEKERFTKDKIITTNLTTYSPKKVRLTLWIK